jgi:phage terminase large subunit GpA-like protein
MTGAAVYRDSFLAGLKPEAVLSVSEWADEHRFLSQKASAEPGRWRTSRTPYLREIMDCLSSTSPIQRVVFMAGAQIGKTETGNNWFGYVVHHSPGPMLFVQPTVDLAKRLSKQRLAPMIEETPVLREMIADSRSRDSGNTMLTKEFRGGVVVLTGANSAVGLRSMPVRYLFLDEVDAFPSDVEGEGDPVKLAERRTTTFSRRKIYLSSTPTIRDASRIEREYESSDCRRYYVPCPHCGHMDWIRWENIKWDGDDPRTAQLACESCGVLIDEHHKTDMLLAGEWRATRDSDGRTAGFHLSSLYSPLGWKSWADIVAEFLAAKNDPPRLKEWVNTVLAETWEETYSAKIGAEALAERAEEYTLLTVPDGGLLLTAGVDVQDNRLAVTVKAWGVDEESWLINWTEIYGDPADLSPTGPWHQVDTVLTQEYTHATGAKMKISAAAVDTGGHFTHEAYMFCRNRKKRHVIAVKGANTPGRPAIGKPSRQDVNFRNQTIKGGVDLWLVGTDTIKATIYGRLKRSEPEGPGAYHFPIGVVNEYYQQLTAEKQITKYVNGHPKRVWIKKDGARNEALDCEVYAYAALQYFYTRTNRNMIWLQAQKILDRLTVSGNVISEPEAQETPQPPVIAARRSNILQRRPRGGFVKRF